MAKKHCALSCMILQLQISLQGTLDLHNAYYEGKARELTDGEKRIKWCVSVKIY